MHNSGRKRLSEGNNSVIALTSGEPSGIGLELSIKAWKKLRKRQPFFLIADRNHLAAFGNSHPVIEIQTPEECFQVFEKALPFLHCNFPSQNVLGEYNPENAQGVVGSIESAVNFALAGRVSGICTNPITKDVFRHAGKKEFSGHTEYISKLCGVDFPVMMLSGKKLRVVPVTRHISLSSVSQCLTKDLLKQTLETSLAAMRNDFGLSHPRVAVSGLNPHAGEGGSLGREELEIIEPVIRKFQNEGLKVKGPYSADTMFHKNFRKTYDLAVAMFHDQALIPIKTLDFYKAVNVTLGLPIIRTSPDHGTAFGIAGKDIARPDSLIEAILLARKIHKNRKKNVKYSSPSS